ncbi:hypothetical protein EW146_g7538 [Bondarzewia mesenterica]|uniref:Uncharacterized protein n=1 Tax=Bondarzewia mesenterica TaxID=1095465 RepID=A0A4S4LMB3_9AGAM|nr:hypothetical protein EW146_g7538 [Bondarzewia mesenterica]
MFGGFGSLNSVESEKRQALRDAYKTINEALNPRNPIRSTAFYVPGTNSMDDLRQRCALLESRSQCFTVQEAKVLSWGDTELLASWAQDIVENLLSNGVRQEHVLGMRDPAQSLRPHRGFQCRKRGSIFAQGKSYHHIVSLCNSDTGNFQSSSLPSLQSVVSAPCIPIISSPDSVPIRSRARAIIQRCAKPQIAVLDLPIEGAHLKGANGNLVYRLGEVADTLSRSERSTQKGDAYEVSQTLEVFEDSGMPESTLKSSRSSLSACHFVLSSDLQRQVMIATPEDFSQRKFHYLVVGGGTAGLVVAARLSEDSEVLVRHLMPTAKGMAGSGIMNERIDWCFTSVPQATANGRAIDQPRKGTRRVFCAQLTRSGASAEEYDALKAVGNLGWNLDGLLKYFKKSETLHYPLADLRRPSPHNTRSAEIPAFTASTTLDHLGVPSNPEPSGGNNAGSTFIAGFVDPVLATRSYSTTAYYDPNQQRKNLVVLTETQATRVLFDSTASPVVATGVEYFANGSKSTAHASQEVFSPPLIANSSTSGALGFFHPSVIGDATLLKKFGIHTVVDLPAVGEFFPSTFKTTNEWATSDLFRDPALRAKEMDLYVTKKEGRFSSAHSAYTFLPLRTFCDPKMVQSMKAEIANDPFYTTTSGLRKQIEYLTTCFDNRTSPN